MTPTTRALTRALLLGLLMALGSQTTATAQSIGRWYMHQGKGVIQFGRCFAKHGDEQEYTHAKIPPWPDGWRVAPNATSIGYQKASILCGNTTCRCGGDFTYFRALVRIPQGFSIQRFSVELRGMDDGTRVTIFNSRYPQGLTPPGGYAYIVSGFLFLELGPYAVAGEHNVVVLTHVDDCCERSNLREAYVRLNGVRVGACHANPERCNGQDDDCNGQIDENLQRPCYGEKAGCTRKADGTYTCLGSCKAGTQSCAQGIWQACQRAIGPREEVCNGQDDDCDGQTDEYMVRACYTGPADTRGRLPCEGGTQICVRGRWLGCQGQQLPREETCNGQDDDCDGQIDHSPQGPACPQEEPLTDAKIDAGWFLPMPEGDLRVSLGGCGCTSAPNASPAWLLGILLAWLLWARGRRV